MTPMPKTKTDVDKLVKDSTTKAVLNTDQISLLNYKKAKKSQKELLNRLNKLEDDNRETQEKLDRILSMLIRMTS